VAVYRVEFQGPLERGARHGATAVGGGAVFSDLPVPCVPCATDTQSQGPWSPSPGGEKGGARNRRRLREAQEGDGRGREAGKAECLEYDKTPTVPLANLNGCGDGPRDCLRFATICQLA